MLTTKTVYPLRKMRKAGLGTAMKEAIKKNFNPKRGRCPRCNSRNFLKEIPKFMIKEKVLTGFLPNRLGRHCMNCGLCFKFRNKTNEIVQVREVPKNMSFGG